MTSLSTVNSLMDHLEWWMFLLSLIYIKNNLIITENLELYFII